MSEEDDLFNNFFDEFQFEGTAQAESSVGLENQEENYVNDDLFNVDIDQLLDLGPSTTDNNNIYADYEVQLEPIPTFDNDDEKRLQEELNSLNMTLKELESETGAEAEAEVGAETEASGANVANVANESPKADEAIAVSDKPDKVNPKEDEDDDIDARLEEELNSLPMVEPEPEAEPEVKPQTLPTHPTPQTPSQLPSQPPSQLPSQLPLQLPSQVPPQPSLVLPPQGVFYKLPQGVAPGQRLPLNANLAMQLKLQQQGKIPQLPPGAVRPYRLVLKNPPQGISVPRMPGAQPIRMALNKSTVDMLKAQGKFIAMPTQLRCAAPTQLQRPQLNQLRMQLPNQMRPLATRPDAATLHAPLVEDDEVDFEEIGVADTYSSYWPSKLKGGSKHPDPVVETATLSSVELPDITYELGLPDKMKNSHRLSALQLEAVTYACQAHEQMLPSGERAGFLLGDGAGVGKGRTIAAIIYENYVRGRKRALWISVSNDLKFDAERDLLDIGASKHLKVASMSKFKYCKINSGENEYFKKGVIFCTYTALIGESANANPKYSTRLRQLTNWMGGDFEGVIVFDECHKAKNLCLMNAGKSTKTGTTVLELQQLLPMARVVYASATGASEPRNMAYMVRLGLWGPGTSYSDFFKFVNTVEKRGIGAMEIVAMDMKLRGSYIARQLSFKDVTFRIEEVPMSREFIKLYNHSAELWAEINEKFVKACRLMCIENRVQKIITCQFWSAHQRFFKNLCIASKVNQVVKMVREAAQQGKAVVIGLQSTGESRTLEHLEMYQGELTNFVSTSKMIVQSFVEKYFPAPTRESLYKLLSTGTFVPESRNKSAWSAKRARLLHDWSDDDMYDDSDVDLWNDDEDEDRMKLGRKRRGRPPKADKVEKLTMQERILQHLCKNMNARSSSDYEHDRSLASKITQRDVERCVTVRERLLDKIEHLGRRMPPNTLDKIISLLGTNVVAEMTGRRGRVIQTDENTYKYEQRGEAETTMDLVNYMEKQRFMEDSKHVAIISEAASSGISLQSDRRLAIQRRRLHITLELPWSADRAIQQFGRTHRSNQSNAPEYVFLISDLGGENRFAATVAKRLESLGALTQGDRRATDARDLSKFNIDNNIGRKALESVLQQIAGEKPLETVHVPKNYKGDFSFDCCVALSGVGLLSVTEGPKGEQVFVIEKESSNIPKFLNRILGCRVEVQNALFKFFLNKMYSLILQMKRSGHFDLGILDLDAHGAIVTVVKQIRFTRPHATGTAATELHTMQVVRGMSFEQAVAKFNKEARHEHEGFYIFKQERNNNNCAILCLDTQSDASESISDPTKINFKIYRPNTGPQVRTETLDSVTNRYVKAQPEAVKQFWDLQFNQCLRMCSHIYWNRRCPFGNKCAVGIRMRIYHVLSGLMLPIWDRIALIIEKNGRKIQMVRVKTVDNRKIVGTVVPEGVYQQLVADLSEDSIVESKDFSPNKE
ncbi:protein strawberry notch [Drosophila albomicans]|uniref:Protein strawberry notch n=1 Tax=Drosophila albomicans TaxID=7291 RepID=A0A6P8WYY4_DROAB|nr:protein strawberry notch [Drosophila albomicans]